MTSEEETEWFMEGDQIVTVTRKPITAPVVSDHVREVICDIWASDTRRSWSHLSPSLRLLMLRELMITHDDFEVIYRYWSGLEPEITAEDVSEYREFLLAMLQSEESRESAWTFGVMQLLVVESAAEAICEERTGTHNRHDWSLWLWSWPSLIPHESVAEMVDYYFGHSSGPAHRSDEEICGCCDVILTPTQRDYHALRDILLGTFDHAYRLMKRDPDLLEGCSEYEFSKSP
jgi:hypothetical protein